MKKLAIAFSLVSFVCFVFACILVVLPKTASRRPRAMVTDLDPEVRFLQRVDCALPTRTAGGSWNVSFSMMIPESSSVDDLCSKIRLVRTPLGTNWELTL